MKFENAEVFNFEGAIRGARNPLESWSKSDSEYVVVDGELKYEIGEKDMKLLQNLIGAAVHDKSNSHSKFLRQILVSVDITAPMYWWSEADTYKVGTTANSTSKMHKLASTPITMECFELDDYSDMHNPSFLKPFITSLEELRQLYKTSGDVKYWKELVRWLPVGWLQTRTVTLNYQVLRQMYFDRRNHKLSEWHQFCDWVKTLPYAEELITYEPTSNGVFTVSYLEKDKNEPIITTFDNEAAASKMFEYMVSRGTKDIWFDQMPLYKNYYYYSAEEGELK